MALLFAVDVVGFHLVTAEVVSFGALFAVHLPLLALMLYMDRRFKYVVDRESSTDLAWRMLGWPRRGAAAPWHTRVAGPLAVVSFFAMVSEVAVGAT